MMRIYLHKSFNTSEEYIQFVKDWCHFSKVDIPSNILSQYIIPKIFNPDSEHQYSLVDKYLTLKDLSSGTKRMENLGSAMIQHALNMNNADEFSEVKACTGFSRSRKRTFELNTLRTAARGILQFCF